MEAFRTYAAALPANCIFLVDTYDSLAGVRNAVKVGHELRRRGYELGGVRLDSGDLAWLSIQARRLLNEAGFPKASIVASNDLDERIITSLKQQGAKIDTWGVGTRLVTAFEQPALGGVYKLSAIRDKAGRWIRKMKYADQSAKVTNPGILNVRRFAVGGEFVGDAIYDVELGLRSPVRIVDPADPARSKVLGRVSSRTANVSSDLLVPVFRKGNLVYRVPDLNASRARTAEQLSMLHPGIKRLVHPHRYPAGLERMLYALRERMRRKERGE
jgi:nicotinate phosphoribosyltransferase